MALPALMIPIILATAALGSGIVQGISNTKNAKSEAEAIQEQTQEQINARARSAKKLMQQQKTSFLKSGVYFDSGTPVDVINETYDTSMDDINAMAEDSDTKVNNLMRQGRTAFFGSILGGAANSAINYFLGGTGLKGFGAKEGISSAASSKFRSRYEALSGKYRGGFGSSGKETKIV